MRKQTPLSALLLFAAACASNEPNVTIQDAEGNYITTSDYESMQRTEFIDSMRMGIKDFDSRMTDLRSRANELGGEHLSDFADCETALREERTAFQNQLSIAENAMIGDWPSERSETVRAYSALRENLDEAFQDVLDS